MESSLVSGAIGGVVSYFLVVYLFRKGKPLVLRDAEARGYSVVAISMEWWYMGMTLRYNVVLSHAGETLNVVADVNFRKSVTWTPSLAPPPAASVRSSDDNGQ